MNPDSFGQDKAAGAIFRTEGLDDRAKKHVDVDANQVLLLLLYQPQTPQKVINYSLRTDGLDDRTKKNVDVD